MIKALLDISSLGAAANPHQRGTIGIFRVVEHTARAMVESAACLPVFYAQQNHAAAQSFFQDRIASLPGGGRARFAKPALPSTGLTRGVIGAEKFLSERYVHPPWRWLASGRSLWAATRWLLRDVKRETAAALDIYHMPIGEFPEWTRRFRKLRRLITIYDLIPLSHPEFYPPHVARHLRRTLSKITPRDWALCISESTRRDLLERCSHCNPERTLVIPLAAEGFFHPETDESRIVAVRNRYGIPIDAPYFLSVSTLEPRKNFETVIEAFAALLREHPALPARLVLVGNAGWKTGPIYQTLAKLPAVKDKVIFTGYVDDGDLAALYSGATAFIYLSFYEGFGLPPLEAMQCGTPAIVSDTSSLPEVVGSAGPLVAPTDVRGVSEKMHALLFDTAWRQKLSTLAVERANRFSWSLFAEATMAAYRRALAEDP